MSQRRKAQKDHSLQAKDSHTVIFARVPCHEREALAEVAERNSRTLSGQLRHYVRQALAQEADGE